MHMILNSKLLKKVECFKYLGWQVAADEGCDRDGVHRMNEGYRAWGALPGSAVQGYMLSPVYSRPRRDKD